MIDRCHVQRLVTATGAHTYPQPVLADDMRARLARVAEAEPVARTIGFVYGHSAIRERHLEIPIDEIDRREDWYRMVNQAALSMSERVLSALFQDGVAARDCDGLVVVTSSYAGFPSLSRRLQERAGFPLETLCWDLAALGCAGPTQGLLLAQTLLAQGTCRAVCLLCVDAMGTHGQARRHHRAPDTAQLVAHCLASDGAAALVLSGRPGPAPRFSFGGCRLESRLWAGSLDQNDLTADERNQPLLSVGKEIRTRIGDELARFLHGDALESPIFFHPGGAALVRHIQERYPGLAASAEVSMSVLADHGNLGASSVLWVLDRAMSRGMAIAPRFRLVALGAGIFTTVLLVDEVA